MLPPVTQKRDVTVVVVVTLMMMATKTASVTCHLGNVEPNQEPGSRGRQASEHQKSCQHARAMSSLGAFLPRCGENQHVRNPDSSQRHYCSSKPVSLISGCLVSKATQNKINKTKREKRKARGQRQEVSNGREERGHKKF